MMGDGLIAQHVLSFQTGTQYVPDTDPPSVLAIYVSDGSDTPVSLPTDNSTSITLNVSPATSIIVEFDEGMSPSSVDPNSFSLIDQNNPTTPINGTFRFFNKALPEPFVEIHPEDAERHGITSDHVVRVVSRRGQVEARARVTDRIRDGTVFLPYHFGYLAGTHRAINNLTNRSFDEFAGQPAYKACAVRIEKL